MRTFDNAELADIIEDEGIGYAVEEYVDIVQITDPVTRDLWAQAETLLSAISQRCFHARAALEDSQT
ncbi:hypothetical protein [Paenibacillus odorifer]|uniref:hypothetical protein n=1 Tax=Paenibacillus TaxID=44249 RepID=UPI00096D1741|nr:hypothetical protein [Paenibacillus odorifer]OMD02528.1 hypothetical protein BJP46_15615 [Paenibacillus odorifer]